MSAKVVRTRVRGGHFVSDENGIRRVEYDAVILPAALYERLVGALEDDEARFRTLEQYGRANTLCAILAELRGTGAATPKAPTCVLWASEINQGVTVCGTHGCSDGGYANPPPGCTLHTIQKQLTAAEAAGNVRGNLGKPTT